jgi:hypothetical protein
MIQASPGYSCINMTTKAEMKTYLFGAAASSSDFTSGKRGLVLEKPKLL